MNSSIKIDTPAGLEHFQKLELTGEAFGKIIGKLAETPPGKDYTVLVTKDNRPIEFKCDGSLKINEVLDLAKGIKKRVRNRSKAAVAATPNA